MGAITPPSDVDELAIVAPTTPKASTRMLKQHPAAPVTPPGQMGNGVATGPIPGAPLDITQDGPPPGQPRKTPRTKRIATQMDIDEQDEDNIDMQPNGAVASDGDDTEIEDKKMEEEEAKDELCALKEPPASPVKGGMTNGRGRVGAPKQLRQAPATERTVRTTRATTRNATAGTSSRRAPVVAAAPAPTAGSASLRARGAAAVAKSKAASTMGAGAPTTSTAGTTSYKVWQDSHLSPMCTNPCIP